MVRQSEACQFKWVNETPIILLTEDQASVVRRCPTLLREMLNMMSAMTLQLQEEQENQMRKNKARHEKRNRRC